MNYFTGNVEDVKEWIRKQWEDKNDKEIKDLQNWVYHTPLVTSKV
jgi:hypothetical protein